MTRARTAPAPALVVGFLAALVLLCGVLSPATAGAPGSLVGTKIRGRTADAVSASPLTIRLSRLAPATIPTKGFLTLAGSVRNSSSEQWSGINVHPFISQTPITTRDDLAAAAASDPETEVGIRLTAIGQFAAIGDLAPGASAHFMIKLTAAALRQNISGDPGVYWIGVHALGANAQGSDGLADGRARTFIPLISGTGRSQVSLVVPIRERVRRDAEARLLDTTTWSETFGPDGRLRRIADLLSTASPGTATLLVDPAVLEAAGSVSVNNPGLSLGQALQNKPTPTSTPTSTPTGSTTGGPSGNTTSRSLGRLDATDQANGASWLSEVIALTRSHQVLGLGYADPDTSSLGRRKPTMLARTERLAAATFTRFGISAAPAVAPPDGWLDGAALATVAPDSVVLVSDRSVARERTLWQTSTGQQLIFTDARAADGGPAPTAPLDALALRQRILSDAALRAQAGLTGPMVVELPPDWDPGAGWQAAHFFAGLTQPWLDLVSLSSTAAPGTPVLDAPLGYPASVRKREITTRDVATARQLVVTGSVLAQLLRTRNQVDHVLAGAALSAVSFHARPDRGRVVGQVLATNTAQRSRIAAVQVIGTDFVTLSGGSGTLAVTLVNGLDQPVKAGIAMTSHGDGVRIDRLAPVDLAPGERVVLRLHATASAIGVHEVTLSPVTSGGLAFGTPLTFSLRTSKVGTLIWIVIIAALALLVVMIGRRIVRGLSEHRWRGQ